MANSSESRYRAIYRSISGTHKLLQLGYETKPIEFPVIQDYEHIATVDDDLPDAKEHLITDICDWETCDLHRYNGDHFWNTSSRSWNLEPLDDSETISPVGEFNSGSAQSEH